MSDNSIYNTYLGGEVNQSFKHILTVHITIIVDVKVNHEARVARDETEGLQEQFASVASRWCSQYPGCRRSFVKFRVGDCTQSRCRHWSSRSHRSTWSCWRFPA